MGGAAAEVIRAVAGVSRVLMCLHRSPDGDSVGSTLAMAGVLSGRGYKVTLLTTDPLPSQFEFLRGWDTFQDPAQVEGEWDLALLFDCGTLERTGRSQKLVQSCPVIVNVDHHGTNSMFGHVNWVDPSKAAAGEMVLELLEELGVVPDADVATALFTAIATDTGFFSFPSTTARVLQKAAMLVELGADPGAISSHLNDSRSPTSLALLGLALGSLTVDDDGRIAWMTLSRQSIREIGAENEDFNGIVNYARSIRGVEIGILLAEQEGGHVKVGLRSHGVDVAALAQRLGGGGHTRAAGCMVSGPLEDAVTRVLSLAREASSART